MWLDDEAGLTALAVTGVEIMKIKAKKRLALKRAVLGMGAAVLRNFVIFGI